MSLGRLCVREARAIGSYDANYNAYVIMHILSNTEVKFGPEIFFCYAHIIYTINVSPSSS